MTTGVDCKFWRARSALAQRHKRCTAARHSALQVWPYLTLSRTMHHLSLSLRFISHFEAHVRPTLHCMCISVLQTHKNLFQPISLSHIHTLLSSDVRRVRIFSQVNELVGPSNALLSANPFHRSINLSQPPTPVLH